MTRELKHALLCIARPKSSVLNCAPRKKVQPNPEKHVEISNQNGQIAAAALKAKSSLHLDGEAARLNDNKTISCSPKAHAGRQITSSSSCKRSGQQKDYKEFLETPSSIKFLVSLMRQHYLGVVTVLRYKEPA
jgi:hypothetical protein